jgi:dTDP-4-amino-4,6-dideoxygalactose transaminase
VSVPLVDLAAQHREIADEIAPQLREVLESGAFIGGPAVADFEREYAEFVGVDHVVGVGNGTDALELALRATDVVPGDEVIMPVHLFGQTAPMEKLLDLAETYDIAIAEDAAQSQGATRLGRSAGSFGLAAGTSFYPGKNLGAAGDAGAVLTDDPDIAARVRTIAAHGSDRKYVHDVVGFNSRLDTVQAVVLRAKLRHLSMWNELRRNAAAQYRELLGDVPGVRLPVTDPANDDVWHVFVIQVDERDRVLAEMKAAGIAAGIHYPTPIHLTGAYRPLGYRAGDFPVA